MESISGIQIRMCPLSSGRRPHGALCPCLGTLRRRIGTPFLLWVCMRYTYPTFGRGGALSLILWMTRVLRTHLLQDEKLGVALEKGFSFVYLGFVY